MSYRNKINQAAIINKATPSKSESYGNGMDFLHPNVLKDPERIAYIIRNHKECDFKMAVRIIVGALDLHRKNSLKAIK